MNRSEAFGMAVVVSHLLGRLSKIIGNPLFGDIIPFTREEEVSVKKHFQEISRIAAEQAAKPGVDGVSLHE